MAIRTQFAKRMDIEWQHCYAPVVAMAVELAVCLVPLSAVIAAVVVFVNDSCSY